MRRTRTRLIALNLVLLLLLPMVFAVNAQAAEDSFWITVDGNSFLSNEDKEGDGWHYSAKWQELSLRNYDGGEIRASGDLAIYCTGDSVIKGSTGNYGGNGITGSKSLTFYISGELNIIAGNGSAKGGTAISADIVYVYGYSWGDLLAQGGAGDTNGYGLYCKTGFFIQQTFATFVGGGGGNPISVPSWYIGDHTDYQYSSDGHMLEVMPKRYTLFLTNGGVGARVVNSDATYTSLQDYYPSGYPLYRYRFVKDGYAQVAWRDTDGKLYPYNAYLMLSGDMRLAAVWESVGAGDIVYNGLKGTLSDGSIWKKTSGSVTLPDNLTYQDSNGNKTDDYLIGWGTDIEPDLAKNGVLAGRWFAPGSTVKSENSPLLLYGMPATKGQFLIYDPTEGGVTAGGNRIVQGEYGTNSDLVLYALDDSYLNAPSGSTFAGWATTKGGSVAYRPGDAIRISYTENEKRLYAVWSAALRINSVKADKTSANIGDTITWTAAASGGSGTLQYCFYVYKDGVVVFKGTYGTAKTCSYKAAENGSYTAKAFVKDSSGSTSLMSAATAVGTTPLSISSITADKTTAKAGDTITWTTSAAGTGTLQYCFYVYRDGKIAYKGNYGAAKTCSYKAETAGSYIAKAFVKDANGSTSLASKATTVTAATPLSISSIKADKTSAKAGDTITWTAAASGGSGTLQYCFYVYKDGKNVYKGTYGSAKTVSYKAAEAGTYIAKAFVKDANGSTSLASEATTVASALPLTVSSITADKTSAKAGDTITWTAAASGGSGTLQYCFYVYKDGKNVYKGTYGSVKTVNYKASTAGTYTAKVFVKDVSGSASLVSAATTVAAAAPLTVSSVKADSATAIVGETITWTAAASGGSGTLQYCFYIYKNGTIVQRGSYDSARTVSYVPDAAGTYAAKVFVKDASGTVNLISGETLVGTGELLTIKSIRASQTSAEVGETITWTASAVGGIGTLKYCFYVYKGSTVVEKGSYGVGRTFSYTPATAGTYKVKVFVKDATGESISSLGGQLTVS